MTESYEAFVYCWTDHKTNKLYIGSHKGNVDDGYICSSKSMNEEFQKRPVDFTRQIIASGTWNDMYRFEHKLLTELDAATNRDFYNLHNGFGTTLTEEVKSKIGESSKARWQNEKFRNDMVTIKKNQWKNMSNDKKEYIKSRCKEVLTGISKSTEHRNNMCGKRPHVNQAGANNNNAKKIKTPYGIFGSISEASKILNIKYDNLWYKLRAGHEGWERII